MNNWDPMYNWVMLVERWNVLKKERTITSSLQFSRQLGKFFVCVALKRLVGK